MKRMLCGTVATSSFLILTVTKKCVFRDCFQVKKQFGLVAVKRILHNQIMQGPSLTFPAHYSAIRWTRVDSNSHLQLHSFGRSNWFDNFQHVQSELGDSQCCIRGWSKTFMTSSNNVLWEWKKARWDIDCMRHTMSRTLMHLRHRQSCQLWRPHAFRSIHQTPRRVH